jgi:hypothetical protein
VRGKSRSPFCLEVAARKVHNNRRIKGRDFWRSRGKKDEFYKRQAAIILFAESGGGDRYPSHRVRAE